MKRALILSLAFGLSSELAFADGNISKLSCRSLDGAAKQVSLSASCNADSLCRASLTINRARGLINENQASNDMAVDLLLQPSKRLYQLSADLTSDDATDVHISVEAMANSVKLSRGSTDDQGSAEFIGTVDGEIARYDRRSEEFVTVGSVKSQDLACKASWSK
jgi:hypothetical protein